MLIITGGQSGGDLGGNYFALKHSIPTEINAERKYKPLYDKVPKDIKINIVSRKKAQQGGWIKRREYNVKKSDMTIILLKDPIDNTRGSLGTFHDCERFGKDVLYINIYSHKGKYYRYSVFGNPWGVVIGIDNAKSLISHINPEIINIAGQRDLVRNDVIKFLEELLL